MKDEEKLSKELDCCEHNHDEREECCHHESCEHSEHKHSHGHERGDCCCHGHHDHDHHEHEHGHGCACCDDSPIKIDKKQKIWQVDKGELICLIISAVFLIAALVVSNIAGEKLFWLYLALYIVAFAAVAWKSVVEGFKGILEKDIFNENTLMNVAAIGAFCIGEFAEGVMVMLLYTLGETIQGISVRKSKKSIGELLDIKVEKSNLVLADGSTALVETSSLKIGDKVLVKVGEKTPVDGKVIEGASSFDYSKLTGESIPVEKKAGDEILGGTINLDNAIYIEVEKEEKDATISKILKLVEEAQQKKPKAEKFVRKFAKVYTPIVFALALIISVFLPLVSSVTYIEAIKKGLVFLVISCPCALVISTPLTYFGGIGSASRRGVLVKGGNYLELLNGVDEVCFDKTGTLTEGKLEVKEIYAKDKELLLSVAGACENSSNHPIAKCIAEYCNSKSTAKNVKEIAGKGLICEIDGKPALCGNAKLLDEYGVNDYTEINRIYSVVYVAYDGEYLGYFGIADKIREKSKAVISDLKARGIVTTMLTGDNDAVASQVKEELGVDGYAASLMPQDKSEYVKTKIGEGKRVMFVGDGLNDAPAIKTASIGVCVSGMGNDASVEASDMVLIGGNIDRLNDAFDVAKKTKKIIVENIVMALGFKFAIMAVCMFVDPLMWLAVVADVGVCLLTILNSMRLLKKARKQKGGGKR
ncbi:MAG: cadmium-translocating P-type ATPase [Clostridia bacterium]|nr:cadmium-translocating P-type ATPase [Clostridia bacterium]